MTSEYSSVDDALAQSYTNNRPVAVVVGTATPAQFSPATDIVLRVEKGSSSFSQIQQMFPHIKSEGVYRVHSGKVECVAPAAPHGPKSGEPCTILVRLLDGTTITNKFSAADTLADVRKWLDANDDIEVLPSLSMPSFANPDNHHPEDYEFTSPTLPRTTYTREQEMQTLAALDLCPRSVVILNPIYTEAALEAINKKKGILRQMAGTAGIFIHALYSFFDYGVDLSETETEPATNFAEVPNQALMVPAETPILNQIDDADKNEKEKEKEKEKELAGSHFETTRSSSPVQRIPVASRVQTIQDDAEDL